MTNTVHLNLPNWAAGQDQPHVTINHALGILDATVQLSVIDNTLTSPPVVPTEGDRYIVAATATGAWTGWDDSVAVFMGGAWVELAPKSGWIAWVESASGHLKYDGGWGALDTGVVDSPEIEFNRALINGSSSFFGNTRVASTTPGQAGFLTAWEVYIQTVGDGTATLFLMDSTGTNGEYTNIRSFEATGLIVGINRIGIPIGFSAALIAGSVVGISNASGQAQVAYTPGGSDCSTPDVAPTGTVAFDASANTFMVKGFYTVVDTSGSITTTVAAMFATRKSRVVFDETFEALPDGWAAIGAWTFSSSGAASPASGSVSTRIEHGDISSLDKFKITSGFLVTDPASRLGVFTNAAISGLRYDVDFGTSTITIYDEYDFGAGSTATSGTVAIPFTPTAGDIFSLSVEKNIDEVTSGSYQTYLTVELTNLRTGETVSEKTYYSDVGMGWGSPAFYFTSGDITLVRMTKTSLMPRAPHIAILGHSFTEGNSISTTRQLRWAQLAVDKVGGDGMISGWGGANSANLLSRLDADLDPFWPSYVIVDIIANDTDFITWKNNIEAIILRILDKGAVPVLMTSPPSADRQAFINSANSWVRSSGQVYIDQAFALTLNNDGVTWNPAYELGDGVHPNTAGHAAVMAQALIDIPWVFDGSESENLPIKNIVAGANVTVDSSDPANPIVAATVGGGINQKMFLTEQYPNNTDSGGSSSGWNIRGLNTAVINQIAGSSVSFPQFTLPAGTYDICGRSTAYRPDRHQNAIYDVTGTAILIVGPTNYSSGSNGDQHTALVSGRIVIAAPTTFDLRHYIQSAVATNGLGVTANSGEDEIYAQLEVTRIA